MILKVVCEKEENAFCINSEKYINIYGLHFNEKLCNYALSLMEHKDKPNNLSKSKIDEILKKYNIILNKLFLWDYVYVANMGYHDYYLSSIPDEMHLALYIKDVIDDEDGYNEVPFCRWKADMKAKEIEVDWELMI